VVVTHFDYAQWPCFTRSLNEVETGDVAKKHFSVSLCTYVNLCIYVSENHKKSAFYFVMWSLNEVETGDVAKKHFSVSLCTYVNLCIYVSKNHKKLAFYIAMSCDDIAYKKRQRTSRWRFLCVFMVIGQYLLAFSLFRALVFCHIVCLGAAIISLPKKMVLSILQLFDFGVYQGFKLFNGLLVLLVV
jgi:hypothetical protein